MVNRIDKSFAKKRQRHLHSNVLLVLSDGCDGRHSHKSRRAPKDQVTSAQCPSPRPLMFLLR